MQKELLLGWMIATAYYEAVLKASWNPELIQNMSDKVLSGARKSALLKSFSSHHNLKTS